MARNSLLPGFIVLVSVGFFAYPSVTQAQSQTNPHFVLTLGATTLKGETTNGVGGPMVFTKDVDAMTVDPAGGINPNGLPTVTLNAGGPSSASVTVKVLNQGNPSASQHFQIVQRFQSQDPGNLGLSLQSPVSFTASSFPIGSSISLRSVLSIAEVPNDVGTPDLGSTGILVNFSAGKSFSACMTTDPKLNPGCVPVPLDGSPAVLGSIMRSAVTFVDASNNLFISWDQPYIATLTTDVILSPNDCPVAGDFTDLSMQSGEIGMKGLECPSTGPHMSFAPTWGPFGQKAALDSTKGEQLTLECGTLNNSGEFQFLLEYTKDKNASPPATHPVGSCMWPHGCNSATFSFMIDKTKPGQPACFVTTRWVSRDYGANFVLPIPSTNPTVFQNPYTKTPESPTINYALLNKEPFPILDWIAFDYDVLADKFAEKDLMFHYADGGPPTPLCNQPAPPPESPPPPPLQPFDQKVLADPPLGPETDAIFDNVFSVLHGMLGVSEGSSRSLADLNYDGKVDEADLKVLQNALGSCFPQPNYDFNADLDGDGCVTEQDLQIWMDLASQIAGPTTMSGNITVKAGPSNARVWTVTFTNNGPGAAMGVQVNSVNLTQTFGAACKPLVTTPAAFPLSVGSIAPAGSESTAITINFMGCPATARFRTNISFSANSGTVAGTVIRYNQFE